MKRLSALVTGHPWLTIVAFLGATIFFAAGIPRVELNQDIEAMIPRDHPDQVYRRWLYEHFAIREPAVILVTDDGPDGVFTVENLALVKFLSDELIKSEIVEGDDLVSLSELDNIIGTEDSLDVVPFFQDPPKTREDALAVREAAMSNPMMVGTLVSRDGTTTIVAGDRLEGVDKVAMYTNLREIVARAPRATARIEVGGWPVIEGEMGEISRRDAKVMFPLVLLVAGIVLWIALRCARGVVLPLVVVNAGVIWALGAMGWIGAYFYAFNIMMPIILVPIGIADGIHIIDHFLRHVAEDARDSDTIDARKVTLETMEELALPVVLTSLTTALGLLSLVASDILSVRSLGCSAAFGVLVAMVFSITVLPALLCVLPVPIAAARRVGASRLGRQGPVAQFLDRIAEVVIRRPLLLITMTFAFVALCVAGFPRLQLDASLVRNFPKNNPVRIADDVAKARFGGSMPAEVALDGGDIDAWKDPAKLRALERLQDALEADGLVAETRSIADYIKRMNEVMNPGDPNGYTIPDDRRLIAQYLLLYSMSGEPDDFDDVVDYDYKMANIRVQVRSDASAVLEEFFARVNTVATAELAPLGITTTASGAARTQNTLMRLLIQGQMLSLAVALLLIVGITALFFRSPYAGIVVAIPVVTATFANFGALALVGEPLGVTTTMVSSVGIGMGIDFAIHFAVRYRSERFQGASPEQAIRMTMESAGTAIFFNALVVVAGFLVLIASDFLPNRAFGCLIALIMTVSFAATVTTLAAVLCWLDPAFLRPCAADGQDPSPPRTEASPLAA